MIQIQTSTATQIFLIAILVMCSVIGLALPASASVTNSDRAVADGDNTIAPGETVEVTVTSTLDSEGSGYSLQEKASGSYDSISYESATIGGEPLGIGDAAAGPTASDGTLVLTMNNDALSPNDEVAVTYTVTANDSEGTITIDDGEDSSVNAGKTEITVTEDPLIFKQSAASTELSPGDSTNITATIDNPRTKLSLNQSYQPEVGSASISRVAKRNTNTDVPIQPIVASTSSNLSTITLNQLNLSDTVVVKTKITIPDDSSVDSQYEIESKLVSGSTAEITNTTQLTIVESQDPVKRYAGDDNKVDINDLSAAGRDYATKKLTIDELAAIGRAYAAQ